MKTKTAKYPEVLLPETRQYIVRIEMEKNPPTLREAVKRCRAKKHEATARATEVARKAMR